LGKIEKNACQTSPSSPSEETETGSGQDAPSLNSENPSNGESESTVGSDRSFEQVSEAIDMPEKHGSVTANERDRCYDLPRDAPNMIHSSVLEGELGRSAGKMINRPNEAFPFPTIENRVDSKLLLPRAEATLKFEQKSLDDEAPDMDNALNWSNSLLTLSSMRNLESYKSH
ncbi:hypothetical protein NW759_015571, partial [Fusarium solani]